MLKQLVWWVMSLLVAIALLINQPAYAADLAVGKQVFSAQCAACHAGGRNVVMPAKTLKKDALEQFGMASTEAIVQQVTKGKGAMPAFAAKLKPEEIESVAAYVLAQADAGWAK
jgi:cytochrome c6